MRWAKATVCGAASPITSALAEMSRFHFISIPLFVVLCRSIRKNGTMMHAFCALQRHKFEIMCSFKHRQSQEAERPPSPWGI